MPTFKIESSFRQSETTSAFYFAADTADAAGAAYLASPQAPGLRQVEQGRDAGR